MRFFSGEVLSGNPLTTLGDYRLTIPGILTCYENARGYLYQTLDGNLYGTTVYGGANGQGEVFKGYFPRDRWF